MSVNKRPFDIGKLDFEGNRKRRRKKLIIRSIPVVALLIILALWLALPTIATSQAIAAAKNNDHDTARTWVGLLATNNYFEPYIRPFNQAIIATNQKRFDDALEYFRQSIALAPEEKKCFIRTQMVLSIELAGDNTDPNDHQRSITYYTRALSEISVHRSCFDDKKDLELRIAGKLADKVNAAKKELYQDATETAEKSQSKGEAPSDKQLQDLQKLQQQGQQSKQESTQKYRAIDGPPQKNW